MVISASPLLIVLYIRISKKQNIPLLDRDDREVHLDPPQGKYRYSLLVLIEHFTDERTKVYIKVVHNALFYHTLMLFRQDFHFYISLHGCGLVIH